MKIWGKGGIVVQKQGRYRCVHVCTNTEKEEQSVCGKGVALGNLGGDRAFLCIIGAIFL